ncbi:hypothetical protein G6011_11788 [Alternaria panax]|uniref:Uncharacterized protein n=1 Tax=Alternaria panax TaxID=48097 RepID=A0AAD4F7U6_9PLEO|nr:hypothetical protein G6011_11788 [Alternaria panax]
MPQLLQHLGYKCTLKAIEAALHTDETKKCRSKHLSTLLTWYNKALDTASSLVLITLQIYFSFHCKIDNENTQRSGDGLAQSSSKIVHLQSQVHTPSTSREDPSPSPSPSVDSQVNDPVTIPDRRSESTEVMSSHQHIDTNEDTRPTPIPSKTLEKQKRPENQIQGSGKPPKQSSVMKNKDRKEHSNEDMTRIFEILQRQDMPENSAMRERSRKLQIKEQELEAAKAKDKRDALEELREVEKAARGKLSDQYKVDIQRLKEELLIKTEYYEKVIEDKERANLHCRWELGDLTHSKIVNRDQGYPIKYDTKVLGARWNIAMKAPAIKLTSGPHKAPATDLRGERYLALTFATATATSLSSAQQVDVDSCSSMLSTPLTNESLALVCFVARILRCIFDAPIHVDDVERTWDLKMVRTMDTLATIKKVQNGHFKEYKIRALAARQSEHFHDEFAKYLPLNQSLDRDGFKLKTWLHEAMQLKLEILVSDEHHQIKLVRPGTTFNGSWMTEIYEEGDSVLAPDIQYRVRLFVCPALFSGINDTKWSRGPVAIQDAEDYKHALLKNKDFFAEDSDQPRASLRDELVSPAMVLVEAVPQDGGMESLSP